MDLTWLPRTPKTPEQHRNIVIAPRLGHLLGAAKIVQRCARFTTLSASRWGLRLVHSRIMCTTSTDFLRLSAEPRASPSECTTSGPMGESAPMAGTGKVTSVGMSPFDLWRRQSCGSRTRAYFVVQAQGDPRPLSEFQQWSRVWQHLTSLLQRKSINVRRAR
jgi:hypothetical protein